MKRIGVREAKARFSELLRQVEHGEQFVITRHGIPVAVLKPIPHRHEKDVREVIIQIKKFARQHSLDGLMIKDLIEEGRM